MSILVTRSSMPAIEDYIEEIKPIFESRWMTNMGPIYKKFQHQLIEQLGVPYLSLFTNGHMALEMAIQSLGIRHPNGEVITTPFSFVSTSHAIVRSNLKPIFCDIRPNDYTIDPKKIEKLINKHTVAIIPVHVYGNVCDVETIENLAKKNHLKVVYDAAHAFGVKYKNRGIGNFGDASMFSFHATKVFNTIEGGAVAFSDETYRAKLHNLKNFGICNEEDVDGVGGNAKLDEFRAAMGICNLKRFDECIEKRAKIYEHYQERLAETKGIRTCSIQKNVTPNYAYFPIYINAYDFGQTRDQIYEKLKKEDIFVRKYFYPAINELRCYKDIYTETSTPIAHDVSLNILTLPMYEELALKDVDRICDIILS